MGKVWALINLRETKAAQVCAGHVPNNPRRSDAEAAASTSVFCKTRKKASWFRLVVCTSDLIYMQF